MLLYLKVACSLSQPTLQTKTNKYCGTQKQASCYKKSFWGGFSLHANGVCVRTCTNVHTCLYMYDCVYVLVWIFMYVCGICVHGGLVPLFACGSQRRTISVLLYPPPPYSFGNVPLTEPRPKLADKTQKPFFFCPHKAEVINRLAQSHFAFCMVLGI